MFIEFHSRWLGAVKAYCFNYQFETLEITHYIDLFQKDKVHQNREGTLFVYFESDEVKALIFFNRRGVMHISNHSQKLYEKVDFLKAIHRFSPNVIKGTHQEVDRVFYFLQRALKAFDFFPSQLMVYDGPKVDASVNQIRPAKSIDWHRQSQFLIEVEKAFREDTLSINYLRQKMSSDVAVDFYNVYETNSLVLGQVIGEVSTFKYGIVGGVYVRPTARGKGIAKMLVNAAVHHYQSLNKIPVLYVENSNLAAISLYDNSGFKTVLDTMEMTVTL